MMQVLARVAGGGAGAPSRRNGSSIVAQAVATKEPALHLPAYSSTTEGGGKRVLVIGASFPLRSPFTHRSSWTPV